MTLAVAQGFVHNQGDAWELTLEELARYLERALSSSTATWWKEPPDDPAPIDVELDELHDEGRNQIGEYLLLADLLGKRTAEMHLALGSEGRDEAFAPEALSSHYQRGLYQSMRSLTSRSFQLLKRNIGEIPAASRPDAERLLERREALFAKFQRVTQTRLTGRRIRCHGDFHLGQVLYTGRDWVILDFEGEPARPIGERRIKRSPLRDVAGMMRSFHYAVHQAIADQFARGAVRSDSEGEQMLHRAGRFWNFWVGGAFLHRYLGTMEGSDLLPQDDERRRLLLEAFMLEKAVYELGYELNNRPGWVGIPLDGIALLMGW